MVPLIPTGYRIIRRGQLIAKIGLSKSSIYARLDRKSPNYDPDFPRPVPLGNGKNPPIGWIEQEVDEYIARQIARSRNAA